MKKFAVKLAQRSHRDALSPADVKINSNVH